MAHYSIGKHHVLKKSYNRLYGSSEAHLYPTYPWCSVQPLLSARIDPGNVILVHWFWPLKLLPPKTKCDRSMKPWMPSSLWPVVFPYSPPEN